MSRRLPGVLILGLGCCLASPGLGEPYGSLPSALHANGVAEFLPHIMRVQPGPAFNPRPQYARQPAKHDVDEDDDEERPAARSGKRASKRAVKKPAPRVRDLASQLAVIRESTGAVSRSIGRPLRASTNAAPATRTWSIRRPGDQRALFTRVQNRF